MSYCQNSPLESLNPFKMSSSFENSKTPSLNLRIPTYVSILRLHLDLQNPSHNESLELDHSNDFFRIIHPWSPKYIRFGAPIVARNDVQITILWLISAVPTDRGFVKYPYQKEFLLKNSISHHWGKWNFLLAHLAFAKIKSISPSRIQICHIHKSSLVESSGPEPNFTIVVNFTIYHYFRQWFHFLFPRLSN